MRFILAILLGLTFTACSSHETEDAPAEPVLQKEAEAVHDAITNEVIEDNTVWKFECVTLWKKAGAAYDRCENKEAICYSLVARAGTQLVVTDSCFKK